MVSNRRLHCTLIISILAHAGILLPRPNFNLFTPAPKVQKISVRYIKDTSLIRPAPKKISEPDLDQLTTTRSEPFLKLESKIITAAKRAPLPYFDPQDSPADLEASVNRQPGRPTEISKPAFINSEVMAIKKKITLPAIEMAKIDNPSYISYYQIVREKIRRSAYQNYTHNETGEIYASFIISNDGYIRDVRLAEDRTAPNDYLKSIALRSIRDASPFPNFPKELDYPQLSFNIIISFEIE